MLLRDLRETTKLLILLELVRREHSKLKTLAERFEMTVQGISDYLRMMTAEGLVRTVGGVYRPTVEGVEFLHEKFSELRRFTESSAKDLAIIDVCWAIAGSELKKGETVGLVMEDGYLKAYPGVTSTSSGRALFGSKKDLDVAIGELEGITGLRPGKIVFGKIPGVQRKGSRGANISKVRRLIREDEPALIAVSGASGKALADRLKVKPDIEFASLVASVEASEKGLRVLYLCTEEHCDEAVAQIMERNANSAEKIAFEIISLER